MVVVVVTALNMAVRADMEAMEVSTIGVLEPLMAE
jgi:hypothetical protein